MRSAPLLLVALASLSLGCGNDGAPAAPGTGRVNAPATAATTARPEDFCDIYYPGTTGPRLAAARAEGLRGAPSPALPAGKWVWINVWATWCKPCMHELPLLSRWADVLEREGVPVELWFYSIDQDAAALTAFLPGHREVDRPTSVRLADRDAFVAWLATLRLPAEATIPLNLLAAPDGHVRCLRTGGIEAEHYPHVKALLRGQ